MFSDMFRDLYETAARRQCSRIHNVAALQQTLKTGTVGSFVAMADAMYEARTEFFDGLRPQFQQQSRKDLRGLKVTCPVCGDVNCSNAALCLPVRLPTISEIGK